MFPPSHMLPHALKWTDANPISKIIIIITFSLKFINPGKGFLGEYGRSSTKSAAIICSFLLTGVCTEYKEWRKVQEKRERFAPWDKELAIDCWRDTKTGRGSWGQNTSSLFRITFSVLIVCWASYMSVTALHHFLRHPIKRLLQVHKYEVQFILPQIFFIVIA